MNFNYTSHGRLDRGNDKHKPLRVIDQLVKPLYQFIQMCAFIYRIQHVDDYMS